MKIENLGNSELGECFLSLQLRVQHAFKLIPDEDFNADPRTEYDKTYLPKNYFDGKNELYLEMLTAAEETHFAVYGIDKLRADGKYDLALYMLLTQEIIKRGFDIDDPYVSVQLSLTPTYIREIYPTNNPGDMEIDLNANNGFDDFITFDYPVREACRILNEKGYVTYWSSANKDDYNDRHGHVIKDKNVAYILIDPANLTEDLKRELLLDGKKFWGIASRHCDHTNYYGIWAEITSLDMKCEELSKALSHRASLLPDLKTEKSFPKR